MLRAIWPLFFSAGLLVSSGAWGDNPAPEIISKPADDPSLTPLSQWSDSHWKWIYVSKIDLTTDIKSINSEDLKALATSITPKSLAWYQSADDKGNPGNFAPLILEPATQDGSNPKTTVKLPKLTAYDVNREFWTAGDKVVVVYVSIGISGDCNENITIDFSEKARKTAFLEGIENLIAGGAGAPARALAPGVAPPPAVLCFYAKGYTLGETRADLAITVKSQESDSGTKQAAQSVNATLVTGPEEHVFFTTDVLVNNASELKFDSTSNTLIEKSTPNNPMIGLNWMIGDPYKAYDGLTTNRVAFKLLASASTPKDVYGAGIGYLFKNYLFDTNTDKAGSFMVFVAYIRTRGDQGVFSHSWRAGLSFNLNSFGSSK